MVKVYLPAISPKTEMPAAGAPVNSGLRTGILDPLISGDRARRGAPATNGERMNLQQLLEEKVGAAMAAAGAPEGSPAVIKASARPEFGDYQANGVMGAAKKAGRNPRELAAATVERLGDGGGCIARAEVAGGGFVNLWLADGWIGGQLEGLLGDGRLGVPAASPRERIVVDYSSPNLAKEMHVGHLRSSVIGDALVRILSFLGHETIRQNHVGDWGTQFGMLIAHLEELEADGTDAAGAALSDLESFYVEAKRRFDGDESFKERARQRVVGLQSGDPAALARWRAFLDASLSHCEAVYRRLGLLLERADVRGESAYNDDLPRIAEELSAAGLAVEDQGALCVFLPEMPGRDGNPMGAIVRKADGGYPYLATDLASLRHRVRALRADRVLYVVDARQADHFRQLFAVARKAGFVPDGVQLVHVPFGTVMGEGGKPLRTRDGRTPKLADLLDEAERRAFDVFEGRESTFGDDEKKTIARAVGLAAVKYADLSKSRTSDYVFDYAQMLALNGNTAPYLLYACTRVAGIFRKGAVSEEGFRASVSVAEGPERRLAMQLLAFPDKVSLAARELAPHVVCEYIYELAGLFMSFYEGCPILSSDVPEPVRESRLSLCLLTVRTLRQGLSLLGIEPLERM
jgi:arginyl-tRNA synthetase